MINLHFRQILWLDCMSIWLPSVPSQSSAQRRQSKQSLYKSNAHTGQQEKNQQKEQKSRRAECTEVGSRRKTQDSSHKRGKAETKEPTASTTHQQPEISPRSWHQYLFISLATKGELQCEPSKMTPKLCVLREQINTNFK